VKKSEMNSRPSMAALGHTSWYHKQNLCHHRALSKQKQLLVFLLAKIEKKDDFTQNCTNKTIFLTHDLQTLVITSIKI
jgi:hypothetical protein